jgi:hypothetical protein
MLDCYFPSEVCRPPELEKAPERQQGKVASANAIATQDFEDRKNNLLHTTRSSND